MRRLLTSLKVRIARAITRPEVGRLVARLTKNTIHVKGATINTASSFISDTTRARLAFRLYESAELRFVDTYLRKDLDVVELGSSIGVVGSVVLGRLDAGCRLIAVEADPDLAEVARGNLRANAGRSSWTVETAAISYDVQGGVRFVRGATSTGGRLSKEVEGCGDEVDLLTLSDLLARHDIGRFALIADIEGAEAGIIGQDESALARCDLMIIELHESADASVAELREALIGRHGFRLTAERGPVLVCARARASDHAQSNRVEIS